MRKLKRVTIKEEFVALTEDPIRAIILNQFIYWSERVADFDAFIAEEKTRAEQSGLTVTMAPSNGWIYKTAEELSEETMVKMAPSTVLRYVKQLVEKGWLDERHNPNHKWDRTKQYRVNLLKIHEDLTKIGYALQGYKVDVAFSKMENASFKMKNGNSKMEDRSSDLEHRTSKTEDRTIQNERAIPEITTEITSKEVVVVPNVIAEGRPGRTENQKKAIRADGASSASLKVAEEIINIIAEATGQTVDVDYAGMLVEKWPVEYIREKIEKVLKPSRIDESVTGFLLHALEKDWQGPKSKVAASIKKRKGVPDRRAHKSGSDGKNNMKMSEKEKEILKNLYMS